MNIRKGLSYIKEHGDALVQARALALIESAPPPPEIVAGLENLQCPAGGWPAGLVPGQPESVGETCELLLALKDLGLEQHALAQRGLDFVLAQQEEEGDWWDPQPDRMPRPRWLRQGEEAGRLYLTSLVGSVLVAYARSSERAADQALDLLLKHQQQGGTFAGFPRYTTWQALSLLAALMGRASGPAQNILRALTRDLHKNDWLPSMFAAMLRNLILAGYGMETSLVRTTWERLLTQQDGDGSWAGEEDPDDTVHSTLDVIWCWKQIVKRR